MKPLSTLLNEALIQDLRVAIAKGRFGKIHFEQAMGFLLNDGILPASKLSAESFLRLEDWARGHAASVAVFFTATELKNKTGEVLQQVLAGKTVKLTKHGRPFAEIKRLETA